MSVKQVAFLFCWSFLILQACAPEPEINYPKWEKIVLDFEGPSTHEMADENPFTDYRLNARFRNGDQTVTVPGFYAADGKAAESSADSGNVWRVLFSPDKTGDWTYEISFRKGKNIAVSEDAEAGEALAFDGQTGKFSVFQPEEPVSLTGQRGRLKYIGARYLQFQENGAYYLKGGADSPENFLAYKEFDGTYASDTSLQFIKTYPSHIADWKAGDPTWQNGKGKGIIGALNYLACTCMNAIYFVTMNIEGDGRDVFPYRDHQDFTRFDVSKLAQWDIVFNHAQNLGILLHFVTQETENELLLDNGDTGFYRKLYYRELIARFAHHAQIQWNLGEENGPADFTPQGQNDAQRKAMATYLKDHDPYQNTVVIHTHAWKDYKDSILPPLLGFDKLDGLSVQIDHREMVHSEMLKWLRKSKETGRQWMCAMDEIGMWYTGVMPDAVNPDHDTIRQEVLWGSLMAGGAGVEWYFGYRYAHNDLNCEDWRSRENMWRQTQIALDLFEQSLPCWEMDSADELLSNEKAFCLAKEGEVYAVYLKNGSSNLNLEKVDEQYLVQWYNPREGGFRKSGVEIVEGGRTVNLGQAPENPEMDWAVLLTKR